MALLQLVLAYCLQQGGLRSTACWASAVGLADISNVALLNRLRGGVSAPAKSSRGILPQGYIGVNFFRLNCRHGDPCVIRRNPLCCALVKTHINSLPFLLCALRHRRVGRYPERERQPGLEIQPVQPALSFGIVVAVSAKERHVRCRKSRNIP